MKHTLLEACACRDAPSGLQLWYDFLGILVSQQKIQLARAWLTYSDFLVCVGRRGCPCETDDTGGLRCQS